MIKFDARLLHTIEVQVKSCSTSMGGYIQVLDEESKSEKPVYKNIVVPRWVVFNFIQSHGQNTKYLSLIPVKVCYYDDLVIDLEDLREADFTGEIGSLRYRRKDVSLIERGIVRVTELTAKHDWYFDGVYAYRFNSNEDTKPLTKDNKFRCIPVNVLDLSRMHMERTKAGTDPLAEMTRVCVGFFASNGASAISSPEWSSHYQFTQLSTKQNIDNAKAESLPFDEIDNHYGVNIVFALKAAKVLSSLFDYDVIEPLNLPELMLELNTVNIPNIDPAIKSTYDIGLKMTHTLAWLLGLMSKTKTLQEYMSVATVLKTLTGSGIFRKSMTKENSILRKHKEFSDVMVKSLEDAKNTPVTPELITALWRVGANRDEEMVEL